ncbi:nicotinate (nicotinamide) nucleotide adenylyltransferase [Campylobacter insulaenigrae]|uniref:Probable nicotinate-nucleotide adenylyltransferase n=1 Tax=Campylobacter insulaenigrae TaxID=260714 RepID=A0ABY3G4C1_9BACT|nr:nicotinate (nicotinamide) nucleotide adenylyltransferase [Campylobacter insulaenigrae]MCR6572073.1 nicotinate (nicotinamide) nucleotide adenylyltransferase [Campylobacter insulaenigrae]MCR6573781.1 nicotinate (nicotinamide) nucleotide adenylyltransferase [Campylobacter insulaenigrae]MCR6575543.1 nicotinate (nicotinamide) nucleotide adenylyltransferase [Campylobacter insulaenigrae]MCR6576737.1 nicotinate (nicotinamide) nucleotide adenylyltransferase [Campylobacter insulaenigrae]MCR6579740.1 
MKIALFGGSFDPPHLGHNAVVLNALDNLDIDKLIIMPTFINPFKSSFAADEVKRLKWVKTLWKDLIKVEICDFEIKKQRPVPSIESVDFLYKNYQIEKFYLILGADHLQNLHKWHEYDRLKKMVEFVIAKRDDISIPQEFITLDTKVDISSSFIRKTLQTTQVCEQIKEEVKLYYSKFQDK